jgi:uncharacterized protein (TIGR02217 family)
MATADQVYLPEEVERGAVVSWITSTHTNEGDDGSDDRYARFPWPKLRAVVRYGPEYVADVEDLFWVQDGPDRSFLFRPPLPRHYTAERQQMGDPSDGVSLTFQLEVTRTVGSRSKTKPILHPRANTVEIWIDDVALLPADFSVGSLGIVTLDSAPADGAIIEAAFEYDTAVHFVADDIDVSIPDSHFDQATNEMAYIEEIRSLTIEEVFNE